MLFSSFHTYMLLCKPFALSNTIFNFPKPLICGIFRNTSTAWTWPQKSLLLLESDFKLTANKLKIQSPQWNRSLKSGRLRSVYLFNREGEVLLQMFDSPNLYYLIQSAAQKQHCFWCTSWHPSSNHKRVAVFSNSLDLPLVAGWLSSVDFEDQDQYWLRRSHWPQQVCVTTFPWQCKSKVKQFHLNQECNRGWLLCRDTFVEKLNEFDKSKATTVCLLFSKLVQSNLVSAISPLSGYICILSGYICIILSRSICTDAEWARRAGP